MTELLEKVSRPTQTGFSRIDAERMIRDHLGLPQHVRDTWQKLVQNVVEHRRAEQLHTERAEYQTIVREWIDQLSGFVDFCRRVSLPAAVAPAVLERAERGLTELREFHDTLFARWQTLDDLYEIVVEQYRLPIERLSAWAAANPPPQSWYDETSDPFEPTEE